MCFSLERIALAQSQPLRGWCPLLLHDVSGLVRHQAEICCPFACTEKDMIAIGKGPCGQARCCVLCKGVRVHTDRL